MPRLSLEKMNPEGYQAIRRMDAHTRSTVGSELLELIKIRASILNGCGYCVDMHTTEARSQGIPARRLHAVAAWEHAGELFDERERAVLALTDAVTRISADSSAMMCGHGRSSTSATRSSVTCSSPSVPSTYGTASPSPPR